MPYNFVVSVHFLYTGNYFVVVMKTFIVTRSPLELWVGEGGEGGGGHLLLCLEERHGTGVSGHFIGSYMNY